VPDRAIGRHRRQPVRDVRREHGRHRRQPPPDLWKRRAVPVVGIVTATAVIPAAGSKAEPKAMPTTHSQASADAAAPPPTPVPVREPARVSRATRPPLPGHGRATRPPKHAAPVRPLRAASFADAAAPAALVQFVPTPTTDASSGEPAVDVGPVTPGDGSAGARIIAEARKYLGVPYVSDGATPDGFDCSGYTMWVYAHAGVAQLPHFADSQRRLMHEIPESAARPGDLIFYLDGDYAYHVAIYAGYGMQYAAPAPGQDVKLEPIWSSDISFGTDWH
jgi:cell wall-associated NlpC family hydrolase